MFQFNLTRSTFLGSGNYCVKAIPGHVFLDSPTDIDIARMHALEKFQIDAELILTEKRRSKEAKYTGSTRTDCQTLGKESNLAKRPPKRSERKQ